MTFFYYPFDEVFYPEGILFRLDDEWVYWFASNQFDDHYPIDSCWIGEKEL